MDIYRELIAAGKPTRAAAALVGVPQATATRKLRIQTPAIRRGPSNRLTDAERARVLEVVNSKRFIGSPWQNAYVESFNYKLPNEFLGIEVFTTLLEAKIMAEEYRANYNQNRPQSPLGYMTPHEFKKDWHHNKQGLTTVVAH